MAHLYKKIKNRREYYYIRETQRIYGKPTTINQVYLGTADKLQAILSGEEGGFSPKEFGSVFILNKLDGAVDLAGMVNAILPPKKRTKGPSLGDLLFYAIMNRAIAPTSKRHLAAWYETTDIQRIRPLRLGSLSSQNFWNHWHRLGAGGLEKIAAAFFKKIQALLPPQAQRFLVEVTHIYSSPPATKAADGGKLHKAGSRVGLAVISEGGSGIPISYKTFPGGLSEAQFFERHLDGLLAQVSQLELEVQDLTFIFNQGLSSQAVMDRIDSQEKLHFLVPCSLDLAPELAEIPLEEFRPIACKANERLKEAGAPEEQVLYYETCVSLGNRPRRVIVTFDPKVFQKESQDLQRRVRKLRKVLSSLQKKYQRGELPEADPLPVQAHLVILCQRLNLSPNLLQVSFHQEAGQPRMSLQLLDHQLDSSMRRFGKNLLITDHLDWGAVEIYQAYQQRGVLVTQVHETKNPLQVALRPLYHWTDSKFLVHLFVCVAALTYLGLLGQRLTAAGLSLSPKEALAEMRSLRTAIKVMKPGGKLKRVLEKVTDTQLTILHALGYQVQEGIILPRVSPRGR